MVYIVLRSGKVIQYNSGSAIAVEDGCISVRSEKDLNGQRGLVARIPIDIVERAEFERPCAIRKAKSIPTKADYES